MRRILGTLTLLASLLAPGGLAAQSIVCPDGRAARADFGIRYRFTAGDFIRSEAHPDWVHFLTEPVITELRPGTPAHGVLEVGDVLVAVDGNLVTTLEGSRRFFFAGGGPVELRVRRGDHAVAVNVTPRNVCSES